MREFLRFRCAGCDVKTFTRATTPYGLVAICGDCGLLRSCRAITDAMPPEVSAGAAKGEPNAVQRAVAKAKDGTA